MADEVRFFTRSYTHEIDVVATSSGGNDIAGHLPVDAIDYDMETYWENDAALPVLKIDLGAAYTIDSLWFKQASIDTFTLYYSTDDITYYMAYDGVAGSGNGAKYLIKFVAKTARYWRINVTAKVAEGTTPTLSLIDDDAPASILGRSVWGYGDYLFFAGHGPGLFAYTFDGAVLTEEGSIDDEGALGFGYGVHGNGTHVFCAWYYNGVSAYTWNGSIFTNVDNIVLSDPVEDVYYYDGHVYVAVHGDGLQALSWNGSVFALIDSIDDGHGDGGTARKVWVDETAGYIYVAYEAAGLRVYSFDGSILTNIGSLSAADIGSTKAIFGDGTYIYAATALGIWAFLFDGTDFIVQGFISTSSAAYSVHASDNHVFAGLLGDGIIVYTFDGSVFTEVDAIDDGGAAREVWWDGDHLFVANDWLGLFAYDLVPGNGRIHDVLLMKQQLVLSDEEDLPAMVDVVSSDKSGGSYEMSDGSLTSFSGERVFANIDIVFTYLPKDKKDDLFALFATPHRPPTIIFPDADQYPEQIFRVLWLDKNFPLRYQIGYKLSGFQGTLKFQEY